VISEFVFTYVNPYPVMADFVFNHVNLTDATYAPF